jgi:hypothetical protein
MVEKSSFGVKKSTGFCAGGAPRPAAEAAGISDAMDRES